MTIRISTATTDDLPEVVASVDALFATDAGAHNAAATNLRWASENGIAYYTSLLADSNARHGFAVRSVTLDLDLPRTPSATRSPDHG